MTEEEVAEEKIVKCIEQLVQIVEEAVKFLSDQVEANLFIAVVALKGMMMTEEVRETTIEAEVVTEEEVVQLCTERLVQIADKVVRFLLDQVETNLFIAVVVLKEEIIQVQESLLNLTKATMISMQN